MTRRKEPAMLSTGEDRRRPSESKWMTGEAGHRGEPLSWGPGAAAAASPRGQGVAKLTAASFHAAED